LRVQANGSRLLFVDVNDVLHLWESAAFWAWLALEGIEPSQATAWVLGRRRGVTRRQVANAYSRVRRNIRSLATPGDDCRTLSASCSISARLEALGSRARYNW